MDISLIVAKLLGIYLIISGLFLIMRGRTVARVMKDFFGHPAIVYLAGAVLVILSSLFLLQQNVWDGTWRTVITLFAWIVLIKGLSYIFFPEALHRLVTRKLLGMLNIYGILAVIAGLSLFYLG